MDALITIPLLGLGAPEQSAENIASRTAPEIPEAEASDEALMIRTSDGSREALATLFRRYARLVRTLAMAGEQFCGLAGSAYTYSLYSGCERVPVD